MVYIILTAVFVIIDQYTKFAARAFLSDGSIFGFIPNIIDFVYVENRGAAFGILRDTGWLLVAITLLVLLMLLVYVIKSKNRAPIFLVAVSLIFAGGVGNLIDRVFFGYVTDFLHFMFIDFPCFNVADICVCIGGALFVICLLFTDAFKGEKDER